MYCVACQSALEASVADVTDDVISDVASDVDMLNDDVMLHMFTFLSLRDRKRCERGRS